MHDFHVFPLLSFILPHTSNIPDGRTSLRLGPRGRRLGAESSGAMCMKNKHVSLQAFKIWRPFAILASSSISSQIYKPCEALYWNSPFSILYLNLLVDISCLVLNKPVSTLKVVGLSYICLIISYYGKHIIWVKISDWINM